MLLKMSYTGNARTISMSYTNIVHVMYVFLLRHLRVAWDVYLSIKFDSVPFKQILATYWMTLV